VKLICEALVCRVIRFLVILQFRRDAVDNIRDRKVATNAFDIINGVRPEQSLQNTRNEVYHDNTALLPKDLSKLAKNFHTLRVYDQFRSLADRRTFGLDTLSKAGGEFENRVFSDVQRDIFVSFFLVAYMDEAVVDTHFEFCGRFVSAPLVLIELFQTLQSCGRNRLSKYATEYQDSSDVLFMSCCSSNATENPVLSRSKCKASI
jgi:hypothetical protein